MSLSVCYGRFAGPNLAGRECGHGPRTTSGARVLSKHRLLFVSTGHHSIRPGGLESYVRDLYEAFSASGEFEPIVLARAGEPFTEPTPHHGWSPWAMAGADPNQYLFYTDMFRS